MKEQALPGRDVIALREAAFTYDEVGSTSTDRLPAGYRGMRRSRVIGQGESRFVEASRRLRGWEVHRRAGVRAQTSDPEVVPGAVAVLRWGPGRLAVRAPVRVVRLVDEPHRTGFVYGTLAGHPESGEEAFVIELRPDGDVVFTITAFSRPGSTLTRLAGPVARAVQSWVTLRYLRAA